MLAKPLQYESETSWFLLLGILDYILTYSLLYTSVVTGEPIVEVNALAAPLLASHGEIGLLLYKSSFALGIVLTIQYIATVKPVAARRLLLFGSLTFSIVCCYQVALLMIVAEVMPYGDAIRPLVTVTIGG